jgi:hypothetical protein
MVLERLQQKGITLFNEIDIKFEKMKEINEYNINSLAHICTTFP